ncbi:MAG TPA: hypothetical protein PK122_05465 [Candidatus Paceibacterota bacterium]|nr:hypothetical protein [Candidatus Paceibacterota bacterium]
MKSYVHEFRKWGPVSRCIVHIREAGGFTLIGFENTGEGTSVTNASEDLATEIVAKEGLDPKKCRFFEFYPEYDGDVDEIIYTWDSGKARNPQWSRCCRAEDNPFIE